ncbi:MAG: PilZ domain-containing protein [Rhodospirillales bacterium]
MWVVGLLHPSSLAAPGQPIAEALRTTFAETESAPVGLVECGAGADAGTGDGGEATGRCREADLGERLTALWESGCALTLVTVEPDDAGGDEALALLDLAVIGIAANDFDATRLGSVVVRLDHHAVPFLFVIGTRGGGGSVPSEIPVTLAQFGTVCPLTLSGGAPDPGLPDLRDYLRGRLDKHYGCRESAKDPQTRLAERRAYPRWRLDHPASAIVAGRDRRCRIVDISGGGLALELDDDCAIGDEIVVTLDGVRPLRGRIVHVGASRIGVRFTMDAGEHGEALVQIAQVVAGLAPVAE